MGGIKRKISKNNLCGEIGLNSIENKNKLIFVTVGQFKFDDLISGIDELINKKKIEEKVIMQIGTGTYKPKYCEYFTLKPSLDSYYNKADIIITHGGAGTLFNCLNLGKNVIAVPNYNVKGQHQEDLVNALSNRGYIIYCKDINNINKYIKKLGSTKKYISPICNIHNRINTYLQRK